jgi:hypothetical protein
MFIPYAFHEGVGVEHPRDKPFKILDERSDLHIMENEPISLVFSCIL